MNILVFNWKDIEHPLAGGAEVFVHEVATRWVKCGHRVRLVAGRANSEPSRAERDGVEIVRVGGRYRVYAQARRYCRLEGNHWADVVVDCVNTVPFRLAGVASVPIVALVHQVCREVWFDEFPLPVAALGRFVFEPAWLRQYRDTPTMTVSVSSLASLARYGLRDLHLIPEGTTVVSPISSGKAAVPTVVFVGRLVANKRPQDAIAAFAELRWRRPDAQLWVIGSGPLEAQLRHEAPIGVTFFGKVSERRKFELMAQAHVLVATSRREGWGLIVTEAAAVGTPSVCYDVPGLRDSIAHSGGGRLVPGTPGALAAGLAAALDEADRFTAIPPPSWDLTAHACMAVLERTVRGPVAG